VLAGLITGTGPGSNPGGDAKLGQANSGTYSVCCRINILVSHLLPSSINLVPAELGRYVYTEDTSDVALAMRHRQ